MVKSPVRNQRFKGIKVKHALQFCFLLAVCLWLIYQVKHSHSKKKIFEDDAKESVKTVATGDGLKLGRKDLNPKEDDKPVLNMVKRHEEAEDEEAVGEEEETKIEEISEEGATVKQDETGGDGVDEMDEHDLEKPDEEVDKEEVMEEVKYDEENSDKNDKEKDTGDNSDSPEKDSSKEEDVEDETTKSGNEAREEQYKADDASSAVTQASQSTTNEKGVENSTELGDKDALGDDVKLIKKTDRTNDGSNTTVSSMEGQEMAEIGNPLNITTNDEVDNLAAKSNNDTLSSVVDEQPNGFYGVMNHTAEINSESDHSLAQNRTETESVRSLLKNVAVGNATSLGGSGLPTRPLDQTINSTLSSSINEAGSNQETSSKAHDPDSSSSISELLNAEKSMSSSVGADVNLQSSDIKSNMGVETKTETDAKALTMDEVTVNSENGDEFQKDLIGSSDTSNRLEEKDDGTELNTLANVLNEDAKEENAAAE